MANRSPIDKIEFVRNALAFVLVLAFISALPVFTFKVIPAGNKDIITYMVGQLSGMATMALGFYFTNKIGQDALDAKRAENTGKLADAVVAATGAGTTDISTEPQEVVVVNTPTKPVPVDAIKGEKP